MGTEWLWKVFEPTQTRIHTHEWIATAVGKWFYEANSEIHNKHLHIRLRSSQLDFCFYQIVRRSVAARCHRVLYKTFNDEFNELQSVSGFIVYLELLNPFTAYEYPNTWCWMSQYGFAARDTRQGEESSKWHNTIHLLTTNTLTRTHIMGQVAHTHPQNPPHTFEWFMFRSFYFKQISQYISLNSNWACERLFVYLLLDFFRTNFRTPIQRQTEMVMYGRRCSVSGNKFYHRQTVVNGSNAQWRHWRQEYSYWASEWVSS